MAKREKQATSEAKSVKVSFNCPENIRDEIKAIAIAEDRSQTMQIVRALREWLKYRERPLIDPPH